MISLSVLHPQSGIEVNESGCRRITRSIVVSSGQIFLVFCTREPWLYTNDCVARDTSDRLNVNDPWIARHRTHLHRHRHTNTRKCYRQSHGCVRDRSTVFWVQRLHSHCHLPGGFSHRKDLQRKHSPTLPRKYRPCNVPTNLSRLSPLHSDPRTLEIRDREPSEFLALLDWLGCRRARG